MAVVLKPSCPYKILDDVVARYLAVLIVPLVSIIVNTHAPNT
jgi:hypothetical protein